MICGPHRPPTPSGRPQWIRHRMRRFAQSTTTLRSTSRQSHREMCDLGRTTTDSSPALDHRPACGQPSIGCPLPAQPQADLGGFTTKMSLARGCRSLAANPSCRQPAQPRSWQIYHRKQSCSRPPDHLRSIPRAGDPLTGNLGGFTTGNGGKSTKIDQSGAERRTPTREINRERANNRKEGPTRWKIHQDRPGQAGRRAPAWVIDRERASHREGRRTDRRRRTDRDAGLPGARPPEQTRREAPVRAFRGQRPPTHVGAVGFEPTTPRL